MIRDQHAVGAKFPTHVSDQVAGEFSERVRDLGPMGFIMRSPSMTVRVARPHLPAIPTRRHLVPAQRAPSMSSTSRRSMGRPRHIMQEPSDVGDHVWRGISSRSPPQVNMLIQAVGCR